MTDITKEELNAYTEAQVKTATAVEKIATCLEGLSNNQEDIVDKLTEISRKQEDACENVSRGVLETVNPAILQVESAFAPLLRDIKSDMEELKKGLRAVKLFGKIVAGIFAALTAFEKLYTWFFHKPLF